MVDIKRKKEEWRSLTAICLITAILLCTIVFAPPFVGNVSENAVICKHDNPKIQTGEWIEKKSTQKAGAWGEAVVSTGSNIYIAWCRSASETPEFWRYDPSTNEWNYSMNISGLPTGAFRSGTALAWDHDDYIYALLGARGSDSNRRLFYRYSISGDSWRSLTDSPHAQGAGDAITWSEYDNQIYAIMGSNEHGTSFARYNSSDNSWEELTPTWTVTDDGCSLVWTGGEYLYALRGEWDETIPNGDFARYNLSAGTWEDMEDIPETEGVGDGSSLLWIGNWLNEYDDCIFALGGGSCLEDPGYNFYYYNISNASWVQLENILCPIGWYVGNRLGFADGHIYYWQGSPTADRWICGGNAFYMFELQKFPVHNINTGENFSTIQAAIDDPDTLNGHTIMVDSGNYSENVVVNKTINLIGEDKNTTVIDGNGSGNVITISADQVNISRFTIRNGLGGIVLSSTINDTIKENNISNNSCDILLYFSNNNTISRNTIAHSSVSYGIWLSSSSNNTINGNNISNNTYDGIKLSSSSNNRIYHNNLINNTQNAYDECDNTWDNGYPSGGNYWSDFDEASEGAWDNNSDGIVDIPYNVPGGSNQDRYPLMFPWGYQEKTILKLVPESATVPIDTNVSFDIVIGNLPNGLSGYNISVLVDNTTSNKIESISFPSWATLNNHSTLPSIQVWIKAIDLNDEIKDDATNVTLATITVRAAALGDYPIYLGINKLDNDDGYPIEVIIQHATLNVTRLPPLPGKENPPTDPDGDGLYEDVNGNGHIDFDDVVEFFQHFEWIEDNWPVASIDFNGNGLIDYDDIVELFDKV